MSKKRRAQARRKPCTKAKGPAERHLASGAKPDFYGVKKSSPAPRVESSANGLSLDPQAQAERVSAAWRGGMDAIISAGEIVAKSLRDYDADPARLDAFINGLVEHGVLTTKEARKRKNASKLVKLRTIGENADWLRRDDVRRLLSPSYTVLYQAIIVRDLLPGDDQERATRFVDELKRAPDEITREFLSEKTDELKTERRTERTQTQRQTKTVGGAESQLDREVGNDALTVALLTPTEDDLRAIAVPYVALDELDRRLPTIRELRECQNLGLVLVTRAGDLPVGVEALLTVCGFRRPARIFLPRLRHDITDENVIVVAHRGEVQPRQIDEDEWPEADNTVTAMEIVALLYPAAERRLHIFAPEHSEGWECVMRDESWVE